MRIIFAGITRNCSGSSVPKPSDMNMMSLRQARPVKSALRKDSNGVELTVLLLSGSQVLGSCLQDEESKGCGSQRVITSMCSFAKKHIICCFRNGFRVLAENSSIEVEALPRLSECRFYSRLGPGFCFGKLLDPLPHLPTELLAMPFLRRSKMLLPSQCRRLGLLTIFVFDNTNCERSKNPATRRWNYHESQPIG